MFTSYMRLLYDLSERDSNRPILLVSRTLPLRERSVPAHTRRFFRRPQASKAKGATRVPGGVFSICHLRIQLASATVEFVSLQRSEMFYSSGARPKDLSSLGAKPAADLRRGSQ